MRQGYTQADPAAAREADGIGQKTNVGFPLVTEMNCKLVGTSLCTNQLWILALRGFFDPAPTPPLSVGSDRKMNLLCVTSYV